MEIHGIMVGKGLKSHPLPPLPIIPACSRAGTSQFLSEFLAPDAFPIPCVPGFSRPSRIPRAGIILEENPEFCVSFPVWFFRFHLEFPSRGESSWEKGWEGSDWETFPVPNPLGMGSDGIHGSVGKFRGGNLIPESKSQNFCGSGIDSWSGKFSLENSCLQKLGKVGEVWKGQRIPTEN